jgi:hypothetical protein
VNPDVRIVADKDDVEEDPWIMVFTPEKKTLMNSGDEENT